jgi:hypothetical protein
VREVNLNNKDDKDFHLFTIQYSISGALEDEIENYLTTITGEIFCFNNDMETKRKIGIIKGYYVDIDNAMSEGYGPFDILDLDGSTEPYYEAVFDDATNEFKATLGPDIYQSNLLIIDRVEIIPELRGRKIGLVAMYRMIRQFSHGCGLVTIKVFPLQFEHRGNNEVVSKWFTDMKMGAFEKDEAKAVNKLKSYYRQLGFTDVKDSDFMILNTSLKQPLLRDFK